METKIGEVKLRKTENGFVVTAQIAENAHALFRFNEYIAQTLNDALRLIQDLYENNR